MEEKWSLVSVRSKVLKVSCYNDPKAPTTKHASNDLSELRCVVSAFDHDCWALVKFGIGSLTPNHQEFLMKLSRSPALLLG